MQQPPAMTISLQCPNSPSLQAPPGVLPSSPIARASRGYAFTGVPTVPVTIAWGTRDRILAYRQAAAARRGLPEARHVDLPGSGHVPMSDDPDLVADLILTTT